MDELLRKESSHSPYISVVLTAYNRKQYLAEAFQSLNEQSLSYEKFEIIIISNYDVDFLPILHFLGRGLVIKTIKQEGPIGLFFKSALKVASGGILCFLDDDDIFSVQKLARVLEKFEYDENLGYYSNDILIINENGTRPTNKARIGNTFKTRKNEMLINKNSPWKEILKFVKYRGNALNSAISIRRKILDDYMSVLDCVKRTEDEVLFAVALDSGYNLLLDTLKLTKYRNSNTNASRLSSNSPFAIAHRCEVLKKETETLCQILNTCKIFRSNVTVRYITLSYSFTQTVYLAFCAGKCANFKKKRLLNNFKILFLTPGKVNLILIIIFLLSRIDKNLPIKLYFAFRGE